MLLERIRYPELDFKNYKASNGRYSIHSYPAMLHYLLVKYLITNFSKEGDLIYDPFCGSGVSIVESLKLKRKVIGTDINPLALLISDVRASNFNINVILEYLDIFNHKFNSLNSDVPEIKNANYWFKDYVIKDLGKIRKFIRGIKDEKVFKFFLVVFSQTIRDVSNNKKGEFKRYRLSEEKLKDFYPDVLKSFLNNAYQYLSIFKNCILPFQEYSLLRKDVKNEINIRNVDLIITSPPYGDSKTTVAYGQFSSFSFDWLKDLNPYGNGDLKIDNLSLGGKKIKEQFLLPSDSLYETLKCIEKIDSIRALEIYSFFYDYYISIKQIVKTLSNNAYICFVVGNRTVKGVKIQMDTITAEFFESFGLTLQNIYIRNIMNKRMPSKNSPSNQAGETSNTMLNEYIVIMKK